MFSYINGVASRRPLCANPGNIRFPRLLIGISCSGFQALIPKTHGPKYTL
jgi:hypothetical protein